MMADLNEELKYIKKKLTNTKSELKLVEDKLEYCQDRVIDIRNEKNALLKKANYYESCNIDEKLKEYEKLKQDFLKQEHRLKITKNLLDDSREEITLLKEIIEEFKNLSILNFIRKIYPENINIPFIKHEKYSKHKQFNIKDNEKSE